MSKRTREEFEDLLKELERQIEEIGVKGYELYKNNTKILSDELIDLRCLISEERLMGNSSEVKRLYEKELKLVSKISQLEIDCGLVACDELSEKLQKDLLDLRESAKNDLTEYEYYTSEISEFGARARYLANNGLVIVDAVINSFTFTKVYNINRKDFGSSRNIEFINNITPYLEPNAIINGNNLVQFRFKMGTYCTIAKDIIKNTWYLLLEDDIVFEHENLIDVLEYRNIVG